MTNQATDIRFLLRDPQELRDILERAAKAAGALDGSLKSVSNSGSRVAGPYTRLDRAIANVQKGLTTGASPSQARDLVYQATQAQRNVDRIEQSNLRRGLGRAARVPSRVPSGTTGALTAGLEVTGALGPEGKAAELLISGTIAAATALFKLEQQVASIAGDFADLRTSTLGTRGETGRLSALGAAGGVNTGSLASSFRDRALSDSQGYAAAQRLGVSFIPGRQQDTGGMLLQAISEIRKLPKELQASVLQRTGLESAGSLVRMSDSQFQRTLRTGDVSGRVQTAQQGQRSADFEASLGNIGTATGSLVTALSGPAMDDLTEIFNDVADGLNAIADFAAKHQGLIRAITGMIEIDLGLATGNINLIKKGMGNVWQGGTEEGSAMAKGGMTDPKEKALDRNTSAMDRLTKSNEQTERARNAIPGAWQQNQAMIHLGIQARFFPQGTL